MAVAVAPLLVSVVELGEVAVLDEVGEEGRDDDEVGFSWNSFLMVMVPDGDEVGAAAADGEEAPIGGNTIRMPPPGEFAAEEVEFFGWRPTALATALMSAALVGKVRAADEGTGVVDPFVLLLLLVLTLQGAASEPPDEACCAYSVLWMILTWAVMLSLRVNSLKQYGHG